VVEALTQRNSEGGNDKPDHGRRVFGEHGVGCRVLASVKRLPKWCIARLSKKLPKRNGEARALEDAGDAEHNVVPQGVLHRFGMSDVLHAFVKRHASAKAEDKHRDDQTPEVQLFAVSKRVLGRGWPLAELEAYE
jgi:hypothetical protein